MKNSTNKPASESDQKRTGETSWEAMFMLTAFLVGIILLILKVIGVF